MNPLRRLGLAVLLIAGLGSLAHAVQPDEVMSDPALEARARNLSTQLRCMVCQNQSIDDSDAPLAKDIRVLVRERLKAGDSDAAVARFLVARFGDFILLKPPFNAATALLWLTPAIALLLGGALVLVAARRPNGRSHADAPLGEAETARLDALLARKD